MDEDKYQRLQEYLRNLTPTRKDFSTSDMILQDNSPHPLDYVKTNGSTQNTHAGQMKLLLADEMSIMQGLLHICRKSGKKRQDLERDPNTARAKVAVVVAGAAPGDHFADLKDTFPFVDFHLYDPAPNGWCPPLLGRRKPRNVTLYTQYFEVQTAEEWQDQQKKGYEHVIFLCDLRIGDAEFPSNEQVSADMTLQKELTETMQACYSVLKFRPRYYDQTDPRAEEYKTLKYFNGTIYLQGYPPRASTETRLHVTDTKSEKEYDTLVYEKQLFYHNQVTRNQNKVMFGPENLSYDNAHARFVKRFLVHYLGHQRNRNNLPKFDHTRLRALLQGLKLLL